MKKLRFQNVCNQFLDNIQDNHSVDLQQPRNKTWQRLNRVARLQIIKLQ